MSEDEDDWVCGESYDHDTEVTYKDAEVEQWICLNCGAEGWVDLENVSDAPD